MEHWASPSMPSEPRFVDFGEQFCSVDMKGIPFAPLGDEVVVIGIEPLGHFHGGLLTAVSSHAKVAFKRDFAVAKAFRCGSKQYEHIEYLIVEREVIGWDEVDASALLQVPVLFTKR